MAEGKRKKTKVNTKWDCEWTVTPSLKDLPILFRGKKWQFVCKMCVWVSNKRPFKRPFTLAGGGMERRCSLREWERRNSNGIEKEQFKMLVKKKKNSVFESIFKVRILFSHPHCGGTFEGVFWCYSMFILGCTNSLLWNRILHTGIGTELSARIL